MLIVRLVTLFYLVLVLYLHLMSLIALLQSYQLTLRWILQIMVYWRRQQRRSVCRREPLLADRWQGGVIVLLVLVVHHFLFTIVEGHW